MFPVVLNEMMLRQLDAFVETGVFAKHKKAFVENELLVLYMNGEDLVTWLRALTPLKKHAELDKLRFEVEEAAELYYAMCDERD
ncbi:hypothetical protein PHIM7_206 [Sinorhizobium phage phiM7]|uniref:Uncharacterized protein n=3 Tax=Emdodecavirus TaxID=1980937 RepID=S5MVI0_9CAUD|nr:hypothetical protein AB690_gp301 [Sinorhizobium phage phiM12]YP_009212458.1 hypothetical protein AVT40_gp315 [Sinorhizobium phage phiN3]YP_009601331.1 hypothetical protein FDH46_gp272 [Sinorhizobium phage phiM7]AKF13111.1 hypothetical protein PHIM19_206 [Sinorhizobium phage phiM19]AGR47907.1 hypothetical protein SmphiM12_275 [Sinorhizobium phage phiM12]AKF12751.1 hypothetical protein PHIM7_206 [Sinorhizobium phage phiM7]AKF13481.1 hypothetical protein PHIN3_218 [Sinorhizobium phage phiN3]